MGTQVSFGVQAATGKALPEFVPSQALDKIQEDSETIRGKRGNHLGAAISRPNDLKRAGWCVIFPGNKDCTGLKEALKPLLDVRKSEAADLFKIFEGEKGYLPGDDAEKFLRRQGPQSLRAVDPTQGVPYYVLIVGSPEEIPFEFQYRLDSYWAVGRLYFNALDDYRRYATSAAAAEGVKSQKTVAVVATRHLNDPHATQLLHDVLAVPFASGVDAAHPALGSDQGFAVQALLAEKATKVNILKLLGGKNPGGRPSLVFSGSHGVGFGMDDPDQAALQGALLCADYAEMRRPVLPEHYLCEKELDGLSFDGIIHFCFACYSAGCPATDTYDRLENGDEKPLMPKPIVAKLPQGLLARGALAVVGHIDRAWPHSFMNGSQPQIQEFRMTLDSILDGDRIGQALDQFNLRWSVVSGELSDLLGNRAIPGQVGDDELADKWKARNDARNYVVLGDPAVRLNL